MKVFVAVKTNVKAEYVERIDDAHFRVGVKAVPEKGKANTRIAKLLADFFNVSPARVVLRSGGVSRMKCFNIE